MPILEIALESGFQSHEAFTRAFKKQFFLSPVEYRKKYSSKPTSKHIPVSRKEEIPTSIKFQEIYTKPIESFRIAYIRKFGSYQELPGPLPSAIETRTLLKFMKEFQLSPNNNKWIGVSNDDPSITNSPNIRFDLGITDIYIPTPDTSPLRGCLS
jgi:AraC family transcriptional regulator